MRSSKLCFLHGLLFLFAITFLIQSSTVQSLKLEKNSKLRGGNSIKSPSIATVEEERTLKNNNQNNKNNQDYYRQWVNYNNNGGGYYRNYNQRNNYMGHRYYGRYYGYVAQQNKMNYAKNGYYNNGGYGNAGDENEEGLNNDTDDGTDDKSSTDDLNFSSLIPSDFEEKFWEWYESPPSEWTGPQWAWFSGTLLTLIGLMFCCCVGCANLCSKSQDHTCTSGQDQDYDDYVSLDNEKRGSFMTLDTKGSADNTVSDDDQTYDSIIRMRSST